MKLHDATNARFYALKTLDNKRLYISFIYVGYRTCFLPNDFISDNLIGWRKGLSETTCTEQSSDIYTSERTLGLFFYEIAIDQNRYHKPFPTYNNSCEDDFENI